MVVDELLHRIKGLTSAGVGTKVFMTTLRAVVAVADCPVAAASAIFFPSASLVRIKPADRLAKIADVPTKPAAQLLGLAV